MIEFSAPARRYLAAACSASPVYAFRPRVIGRLASFADSDTDAIVASLRRAGMVETDSDCHARLTERVAMRRAGLRRHRPGVWEGEMHCWSRAVQCAQ